MDSNGFMSKPQTVPQSVVAESALGADPALQMRMRQFAIQLLKTGQAKHKAMEDRQEDAGWRDLRIGAGVRHLSCMSAQAETLVEPSGKRRQGVRALFHP
jgi:hypothetical protein